MTSNTHAAVQSRPALRAGAMLPAIACALLAACASNPPAPVVDLSNASAPPASKSALPPERSAAQGTYRVVRGDTLYAIAFRHGVDFRDIAAWNRIVPPYRIYAGQELWLQAPDGSTRNGIATVTAPKAPAAVAAAPPSPGPAKPAAPQKPAAGMFEDVPPAATTETTGASERAAENAASATPARPAQGATGAPASAATQATPSAPAPTPAAPAEIAAPATGHAGPGDSVAIGANGIAWRWPGKGTLIGTYVAGDQTRQGIDIAGQAGDPVLAAADGEVVYSGNGLLGYGELIIVKHSPTFLSAYGHNRKRLVQEGQKIRGGQQIAEMGSSASSRDELHFEIRKNGKPVNPLDYLPAR